MVTSNFDNNSIVWIPLSLLRKRYKEVLSNYTLAIPGIRIKEGFSPDIDFSIFKNEKLNSGFRTEKNTRIPRIFKQA